ncbi:50S ribosomal protein L11 [Vermiphilus pyriformis]|jgi:large subunit ribosomal protein L11|uniref:Large ribosomal subunit protein uL11 n=1 Tax=candidate division TM6 bacterium JCVI TM6SC1 TaxID=1306947 RepID=A0A0D2JE13_9BACT|nr:50S ribosomal protein L11 [candidate division TM6 bacterium JCVI TM6SC1]UNE35288.1 MAG: 50S ribosomal protein L11 [Vermiphilus pyriformis]
MSTKQIKATLKLLIPGAAATPAPPVGSALGQQQVNIMEFCKQFNSRTSNRKGEIVPVIVTVYTDKTFTFITKTTPTSALIKGKIGLDKGSSRPNTNKVGKITWSQVAEIAQVKMADLNANDIEHAKRIVAGSARSMGVEVVE